MSIVQKLRGYIQVEAYDYFAARSALYQLAATTTVLVSSSPTTSVITTMPSGKFPMPMSSSPSLPSPAQLYAIMPSQGPSELRAIPMPADTAPGFASALTLLRKEESLEAGGSPPRASRPDVPRRHKLQRPRTENAKPKKPKLEEGKGRESKQPVKAQKAEKLTLSNPLGTQQLFVPKPVSGSGPQPQLKSARKRKTKTEGPGQAEITGVKVTKLGIEKYSRKAQKGSTLSKNEKAGSSTSSALLADHESRSITKDPLELHLKKATKRRADWTPVKDTTQETKVLTETPVNCSSHASVKGKSAAGAKLASLLDDFGFSVPEKSALVASETASTSNVGAVVKRRKIDLVTGLSGPFTAEQPKRSKAPKKKPQTITEKSTAPFVPQELAAPHPVFDYFGSPLPGNGDNGSIVQKPRSMFSTKKTAKPKLASTRANKRAGEPVLLLSPETAMKRARDQELIFGTSSQLAREESPTVLRDLQQAIQASESIDALTEPQAVLKGPLSMPWFLDRPSCFLQLSPSRSLWSAAARDFDESLLGTEVIDLSRTPRPAKAESAARASVAQSLDEPSEEAQGSVDEVTSLKDNAQDAMVEPDCTDTMVGKALPLSAAETVVKKRPKSKAPVKKGPLSECKPGTMPNYNGFTEIQLKKEIASYGFKAIKKREVMISMLEKCWKSKMNTALQKVPANATLASSLSKATSNKTSDDYNPVKKKGRSIEAAVAITTNSTDAAAPKKPRGRPRKDCSSIRSPSHRKIRQKTPTRAISTDLGDEIYDSAPPTPSPPRRATPTKALNPLPLSPSQSVATPKDTPAHRSRLLTAITTAITSFPPTNDPQTLTWYEKILMYEPIVIEDLAVWLNKVGLGRIGEDDEVGVTLVKEWCEGRSICCLWRENLRGGQRGRW
ncbi:MAG: hypothetical protein Q9217_000059 [Psora testacea]